MIPGMGKRKVENVFTRWYVQLFVWLGAIVTGVAASSYVWITTHGTGALKVLIPLFALVNLTAPLLFLRTPSVRLRIGAHGVTMLLVGLLAGIVPFFWHIFHISMLWSGAWKTWLYSVATAAAVQAFVLLNGIVCVYLTTGQLTLRWRVFGIVFGLIPIVHIIVLGKLITVSVREVNEETARAKRDRARKDQRICQTKYPILLVHGFFFRDYRFFNYWGRIPAALEANGATLYYGSQQSAASVYENGEELAERIRQICEETGCGKVNVIAHSKGGLDTRAAIAKYGAGQYIASVTTVNTPHRGCIFADYLLGHIGKNVQDQVAGTYNSTLKLLGDPQPDFMAAVHDLTASRCAQLQDELTLPPELGIFCQSVGSRLKTPGGGRFPLNFSWGLVKHFDGPNDGLVSENSFAWGERCILLVPQGRRGISHGDVIDLNRENLPDFDVREFYVGLVADLKNRGL